MDASCDVCLNDDTVTSSLTITMLLDVLDNHQRLDGSTSKLSTNAQRCPAIKSIKRILTHEEIRRETRTACTGGAPGKGIVLPDR